MSNLTIVFPGQGSQRPGMAKDFCDKYPESRDIFARASTTLGLSLEEICFTENETLNQTEYTQPAILTAEIAMLVALQKDYGLAPTYFGGHSLGEYTALVAAGAIPFEDALQIVRRRGALMQQAVPVGVGAMAALIMDDIDASECRAIVEGAGAELANLNSKSQFVISGETAAVQKASELVVARYPDLRAIPLNVSAPFHCSLMRGIGAEFQEYLTSFSAHFNLAKAKTVVSNFTGGFHTPETMIPSLVQQISGSVQWIANMQALQGAGGTILEIGPGRVLSKFFATIGVTANSITDIRSATRTFSAQKA